MKLTRILRFKKAKINEKHYGYGFNSSSTYDVISDGAIVRKITELCEKYNAEIIRINLTNETGYFNNKNCFIKIKAHKKDFINIVNEFSLYFIKWLSDIRY